ncbi:MAG: mycofactocin biosynthesis chaperone MftB [Syntrophobacteraceae bacterium]
METDKAVLPVGMSGYTERSAFRLVDGIRVRREKFGLLFYDYKGPKIYFVASGRLVEDDFFEGKRTIGQLADGLEKEHGLPRKRILNHLESLFHSLEIKGLINGQPIC